MGSNLGNTGGRLASRRPTPQLKQQVDDLFPELEQLLAAAESARSLLGHPGWDVLSSLTGVQIAEIDAQLDGRLLESRAEYAALHGRRGGLRTPEQALHALVDRAESRLEEQRAKHEGDAGSSPGGG